MFYVIKSRQAGSKSHVVECKLNNKSHDAYIILSIKPDRKACTKQANPQDIGERQTLIISKDRNGDDAE
jgi:hypothetical protein